MARKTLVLILCFVLAACNLPQSQQTAGAPQVWFDMPLDQSSYPLASVPVVFHAFDPGGIGQAELWVNGQPEGTFNSPDVKASLVTFNRNWTPPAPGKYTLQARARNNKQAWGGFAKTTIVIPGQPPTTRITPTAVQDTTPPTVSRVDSSPNPVYYGGTVCGDTQVKFKVNATDDTGIATVTLSYHLTPENTIPGEPSKLQLNLQPDGTYGGTLNIALLAIGLNGAKALVNYQIIAQDIAGNETIYPSADKSGLVSVFYCPPPSAAVRASPTVTVTATPRPTPTASPTATQRISPTAPPSGGVTVERISTNLVYLGRADCGPLEVTITARATAPNGIKVVVLFYRFMTGSSSSEFQSIGMSPIGGDLYERTLNPTSLLGGVPFDEATLQYQIVIQQNNGDVSLRTPVLADIAVKACGSVTAACSSYTDERTCIANGCNWVNIPGTVPIYECRNP